MAYSLYVLAIAGKPNVSAMNYYKANPQLLSLDSRYLLSVRMRWLEIKNKVQEILPASFSGEESVAQTGGSFYSDIRDEAIALNALIDADPANAQIPIMAKHVADKLKATFTGTAPRKFIRISCIGENGASCQQRQQSQPM